MSRVHGFDTLNLGPNDQLGQSQDKTASCSEAVAEVLSAARDLEEQNKSSTAFLERNIGTITLWANGFQLQNGHFCRVSEIQNQEFLEVLKAGEMPTDIEEEVDRVWGKDVESVGITIINRSSETHPDETIAFEKPVSQGCPQSPGYSFSSHPHDAPVEPLFGFLDPREHVAPCGQPVITVQVRTTDGGRTPCKFAASATVADLYSHVAFITDMTSFSLSSGFPPVLLKDMTKTMESAGLKGAVVHQRLQS